MRHSATLRYRVLEASVYSRPIRTRMPFRFGRSAMTEMPVLHLRLIAEAPDGSAVTGTSAAGIPPLWFDKGEGKTHADNIRDLNGSLEIALKAYLGLERATIWELHAAGQAAARNALRGRAYNDLTAGFGIALLDAALIDAACRHTGLPFHAALLADVFGWDVEARAFLPPKPLERISLRHTVGISDPLTGQDQGERIADGLPETLVDVVRAYRPRYFKVKIGGDPDAALYRLRAVAKVLDTHAPEYKITVDGNEQFRDMESFQAFLKFAEGDPSLRRFWGNTLWIEQPVGRDKALDDSVAGPLRAMRGFLPVIIDESDGTDEAVERALSLGYGGVSAKNCKGVFRTLHSYRLIRKRASEGGSAPILSSEDLTNTPIVPLHQDLCVAAALGIGHSERNGHHYVIGSRFLSEAERGAALREYPSLYRDPGNGYPLVRIEDGYLDVRDVNRFGFGVQSLPDWAYLEKTLPPQAHPTPA